MGNTPNIRFKGFDEDWEQRKLGEVAKIISGGTPSTKIDEYWDGDIDWYAPAEIGEQIYLNSSQRKITRLGLEKSSAKMLPIGTVLFTSRAGIGKSAILLREGCTNQGFQSIVPKKEKLDSYFIFTRSEELKRYGETVGAGSTFVEVSGKQMANMNLMMPKTILEQQVIGKCFCKIDHLITLHQRKCQETKKLKEYMLQKMFPPKGEKIPEIRFAGFTGDWEQRKLGEIADLTSSKRVHAQDYVDSGIPFYRGKEISELREHKPVSEVLYITEEKYKEMAKLYGSPQVGDLLITAVGTIGNTWVVDNVPFYFKDGNLIWFKNIKCNPNYLDYALSSDDGQKKIDASAIGSNQKALTMVKMNELKFMFPNDDEQVRIADYFRNLDNLITLHQCKVRELTELKNYMLQNMFPKKGGKKCQN